MFHIFWAQNLFRHKFVFTIIDKGKKFLYSIMIAEHKLDFLILEGKIETILNNYYFFNNDDFI